MPTLPRAFLDTIQVANTSRGYATALGALVANFGADSATALLEPERVGGWFTFKWGDKSTQTFNVRLAALRSACEYWRAGVAGRGSVVAVRIPVDAAGPFQGADS
ncbi:hypothetical protein [Nocardia sp. NPDC046763]|uniref:hypothetical protein n=1 Tax=Nocardia sp. NPDC046763 TaxID=3155256 RepID=UPI0033E895F6